MYLEEGTNTLDANCYVLLLKKVLCRPALFCCGARLGAVSMGRGVK